MSLILNLRAAKSALNAIKAPCVSPTAQAVEAARNAAQAKKLPPLDYRSIVLRDYADYQEYKKRKSAAADLVAKLQQQLAATSAATERTKAKIQQCRLDLAALVKPPKLDRDTDDHLKHRRMLVARNRVPNRSDVGGEHLCQFDYITEQYRLQTEYEQARQALNKRIAELNHSLLPSDSEAHSNHINTAPASDLE